MTDTPTLQAEAEHRKQRFEVERERLAKLWVAYKSLETEMNASEKA